MKPLSRIARAVFLDRDGVVNRALIRDGKPYPPAAISELEILPGVRDALMRLHLAGFRLIVVTNQPDVARGSQTRKTIEAMHALLKTELPIDEFRVCYHDDKDLCTCRKPAPGMLFAAACDANVDLAASFMIGDRWRDIEAGKRAGCITIYIDNGYAEKQPAAFDKKVKSLPEASEWICKQEKGGGP